MKANEFDKEKVINLKESLGYQEKSIVSRIVIRNERGNVTLMAFDAGESLSEHTAPFDAFVQILDGSAQISIDGKPYNMKEGESIIMPANIPHAVYAVSAFKMMLVMVKA